MNWMKVKVILIILFLIIDVLLVGIIISKNYTGSPDNEKVTADVSEIMAANSITVPKGLISAKSFNMEIADAYPIASDSSEFLKTVKTNGTVSETGNLVYNGSEITVYDNLVHFENSDTSVSDAESLFSLMGIDFSNATLVSGGATDDGYAYTYCETYNGFEIFGSSAKITVSEGYVVSADVVWYEISRDHLRSSKTLSSAEALLDFASDKSRGNKPCSVSDITLGYSVDAGVENASVSQMIPSICITTDIGSTYFYDARSPEQ